MPAETTIACENLTKRFGHFTAVDHRRERFYLPASWAEGSASSLTFNGEFLSSETNLVEAVFQD
ncbi:MAG: hypothetical protein ABI042_04695 [Verrucomicrobiota bacterium]